MLPGARYTSRLRASSTRRCACRQIAAGCCTTCRSELAARLAATNCSSRGAVCRACHVCLPCLPPARLAHHACRTCRSCRACRTCHPWGSPYSHYAACHAAGSAPSRTHPSPHHFSYCRLIVSDPRDALPVVADLIISCACARRLSESVLGHARQ